MVLNYEGKLDLDEIKGDFDMDFQRRFEKRVNDSVSLIVEQASLLIAISAVVVLFCLKYPNGVMFVLGAFTLLLDVIGLFSILWWWHYKIDVGVLLHKMRSLDADAMWYLISTQEWLVSDDIEVIKYFGGNKITIHDLGVEQYIAMIEVFKAIENGILSSKIAVEFAHDAKGNEIVYLDIFSKEDEDYCTITLPINIVEINVNSSSDEGEYIMYSNISRKVIIQYNMLDYCVDRFLMGS